MKSVPYFFVVLFSIMVSSCSNESIDELIAEPVVVIDDDDKPDGDNDGDQDEDDPDPDPDTVTEPCEFNISDIIANTTININCILDLNGQTINLPNNVNFDFDGGDIINGTLKFAGGYIDGRLMSSKLTLQGDVRLKEPKFTFTTKRWDIVQGKTSDDIARKNKKVLKDLILQVKEMGGNEFLVDNIDAYFYVGSEDRPIGYTDARDAITIPGDFTFRMTDNTHFRVQPNIHRQYTLMSVTDGATNVVVEGGFLHGDRDDHDYSVIAGTHEWGHVFMIAGATNVIVRGVTMTHGSGDGLDIRANVPSNIDGHISSTDILVEQCTFDTNRRNNVSITDGNDIRIHNNLFLNAGVDTPKSKGTAPRYGLDVEEVHFEEARDITISNNVERGSANGAFLVAIGYDVTIENNTTESPIGYGIANGIIIRNNVLSAVSEKNVNNGTGIFLGRNDTDEIFGIQVYGNEVNNFSSGIYAVNKDIKIFDNKINNCKTGIRFRGLEDAEIYNNRIVSNLPESIGFNADTWLNNVKIDRGNFVDVKRQPFKFVDLNNNPEEENYSFTVDGNTFNSTATANISGAEGFTFNNNTMNTGIEMFNSSEVILTNNKISPTNSNGIHLRNVNEDITLTSNQIEISNTGRNFDCIKIDSTTSQNEVSLNNNDCM